MTARIHFTKKILDSLPSPPSPKRAYYHDQKVNGLVLCITANSARSFQVYRKVQGKPLRVTLGRYPDMTIEQARRIAQETLSRMAEGINPLAERKAQKARALTLDQIFEDYLKGHDLKPRTVRDYQNLMDEAFADWRERAIVDITRDAVQRRHTKLGERSEARANNAMRLLRALLNFAAGKYEDTQGRPLIPDNPVKRLSATRAWFRVDRRRTVIKPHQLEPWFQAVMQLQGERTTAKAEAVRDYLLFLLLTGLRRGEGARLRWVDVDLEARSFKIPDTKNREIHELPLSDFLFDLIAARHAAAEDSPFVFPGNDPAHHLVEPRRWMRLVVQASGVEFTLHDLRRTFATIAESLDIPAYALKRLLNHRTGADVTAGYVVIDVERLRAPMQKITDFVLKAAGAIPTAEVIPLASLVESERTS
jgi:integrase